MRLSSSRRCFQCDKLYPLSPAMTRCPVDGSLLAPPRVGQHWQVDGVMAPRPAGGLFLASQTLSGARGALALILDTTDTQAAENLEAEIRAIQLLAPHPGLLKLLEVGQETDGARFYVVELQGEQLLSEILKEWRHPASEAELMQQAVAVVRPLLRLLSDAHQNGIAHGALSTSHIFVYAGDAVLGEAPELAKPRMHGLRRLGKGAALGAAVQADVTAMGQLLHELLLGRPARLPIPRLEQESLRRSFGAACADFLLRALGIATSASQPPLASADEMLQALLVLSGDSASQQAGADPSGDEYPELPSQRTTPTAIPSQTSLVRHERAARAQERMLGSLGADPLTALPESDRTGVDPGMPVRISADFVSIDDLLGRAPPPAKTRTLARARFQVSYQGVTYVPRSQVNRPSEVSAPEMIIEVGGATGPGPTASPPPEPNLFAEPTQPLANRRWHREPQPAPIAAPVAQVAQVVAPAAEPARPAASPTRLLLWLCLVLLPVSVMLMGRMLWVSR